MGIWDSMVEHFYVKFGDPSCMHAVFETSCGKTGLKRRTDRQTNAAENSTPATTVGVGQMDGNVMAEIAGWTSQE